MELLQIDNQTDFEIECVDLLSSIALAQTDKIIELIFTDNDTISSINAEFRDKPTPTDVLSFPLVDDGFSNMLGSIVISIDKAKEKADELSHTVCDEIALLFIHGVLHLLGYDHEIDDGQMREQECQLIAKFDLPPSLIVRTKEN
jgi:probable rRNA maturation factor